MEHRSRSRDEFPWVGIIILNWRGLHHTLACLKSLDNVTYPHKRVIVVENGSGDRSAEEIRAAFPSVIVLEQHENYGFAKGNNIGIDYAKSQGMDYVLLLNNDVEVEPGFLNFLVAELERQENAGIAGPTIYYFDQPDILWSAGGGVDWKKGNTYMIGDGQRDQGQFGALAREVEWITGCALLIKMEVIHSVGGLDERFFAYYEETEFCIRARRAGWTIIHVPPARIWHKISLAAREASPQVNYYMTRNRLLFLKLVKAGIAAMIYTIILEFGFRYVNWFINPKWRSKRQQRYALLRGVLDYCRGNFGKMDIQESSVSV